MKKLVFNLFLQVFMITNSISAVKIEEINDHNEPTVLMPEISIKDRNEKVNACNNLFQAISSFSAEERQKELEKIEANFARQQKEREEKRQSDLERNQKEQAAHDEFMRKAREELERKCPEAEALLQASNQGLFSSFFQNNTNPKPDSENSPKTVQRSVVFGRIIITGAVGIFALIFYYKKGDTIKRYFTGSKKDANKSESQTSL